jgi:hypothetical protein
LTGHRNARVRTALPDSPKPRAVSALVAEDKSMWRWTLLLPLVVLLCSACSNPAAPELPPEQRLQVCMAPDTVPVTVNGDSTAFVFQKCF